MRRTDVTDVTDVADVADVAKIAAVTEVPEEAASQIFVLDDRIFENKASAAPGEPLFHLEDADGVPDTDFDAAASSTLTNVAAPHEDFVPVPPEMYPHPTAAPVSRRILSPSFWLLVFALLLIGVALFVFQHGYFGARTAEVITPQPRPSIVTPVVVPPIPKKTARRPAARAVAAPPLKKDTETPAAVAPVRIPPAPKPAAPNQAAPAVSASHPRPSDPDPPPLVEGRSVPAAAAPSQEASDEEGWFNLAEEYLQMGDEGRAEALYRRILKEGNRRGQAALALGDLFARRNDFDRAQEYYRRSKQLFQGRDQQTSPP